MIQKTLETSFLIYNKGVKMITEIPQFPDDQYMLDLIRARMPFGKKSYQISACYHLGADG